MKFDAVVVGSGIAGLSFALKSSKLGHKVAIITKKERSDTNTNHAQGGIASVTSCADDFDSHVKDTLVAGDGLCDEAAVREIVKAGPRQIKDLIEEGVEFTSLEDGSPSLGREGALSCTFKVTVPSPYTWFIQAAMSRIRCLRASKRSRSWSRRMYPSFAPLTVPIMLVRW